jgi:hypothetical protein
MDVFTEQWQWVLATLVGIVSVARTARLLIYDEFPPLVWARTRFVALLPEANPWAKIAECQFCLTPYLAAGMLAWAWASDLNTAWWVINGVWAGSYLAAILVSYDQPED